MCSSATVSLAPPAGSWPGPARPGHDPQLPVYPVPKLGQGLQGGGQLRPGLGLLSFAEALKVGDGIVEAESILDDAGVLVGVLHERAQLVKRPAQLAGHLRHVS